MNQYLMLDRRLLNPQSMENVRLRVEPPVKDVQHNPLFTEEKPWEVRIDNGYPNVLYDPVQGVYHCYYTLFIEDEDSRSTKREDRAGKDYDPRPDRVPGLAYAESADGIHWEKPCLGRVLWGGSRENNLIFPYAHGTGVMLDLRDKDPSRRYKLVTKMDQPGANAYMAVSFSPDGINWEEPVPWPEYNPPADSHNFPFWNEKEGCYMLVSRIWKDGIRITTLSRSSDFLHWSEPKETLRGRGFENQIYAMPVFPWSGLYLGLASMIHEGDRSEPDFDTVDLELTWAADPERFDFAAEGQHVISRGKGSYPEGEFDCGCIYASPPVTAPDGKLWLYYMGGNGRHTNFRETSLGRAGWEPDRFAAMEPKKTDQDSVLATCRLVVEGQTLMVLAKPLGAGWKLEAAFCPSWNQKPYEGFSYEDSHVQAKEDGWYCISFAKGLEPLMGKKASLKLRMRQMKVWALKGDIRLGEHRLWEGAADTEEA